MPLFTETSECCQVRTKRVRTKGVSASPKLCWSLIGYTGRDFWSFSGQNPKGKDKKGLSITKLMLVTDWIYRPRLLNFVRSAPKGEGQQGSSPNLRWSPIAPIGTFWRDRETRPRRDLSGPLGAAQNLRSRGRTGRDGLSGGGGEVGGVSLRWV